jgi:hypothetical protein
VQASAGVTADSYDGNPRDIGLLIGDAEDGNLVGVHAANDRARLTFTSADGTVSNEAAVRATYARLRYSGLDTFSLELGATGFVLSGVPTVDPVVSGALWSSAGTLKISTG